MDLSEFYKEGMTYFIASIGMCLNLTIVGLFFAKRMKNFLGKTSIAAIMRGYYGEIVGNITCILGVATSCGGIALQFKIMGSVLNAFLPDIPLFVCIAFAGVITTVYTSAGGIRSVVRTCLKSFYQQHRKSEYHHL